jgi:glycosyltransferase involved in cell wall biosynthesis
MHEAFTNRHIVLAHDWLVGLRGGEWVLDRMARLFGPTTLYTLVNDGRPLTPAIDACRIVTSPLQHLPGAAGDLRRWYLPLMPWAVNQLKVEPCDLVISTSSAVIKSIRPPRRSPLPSGGGGRRASGRVPSICYCFAPARYIWDQTADYAAGGGPRGSAGLRTIGLRAIRRRFQAWDRRTSDRVDVFIADSAHTARRIKRFYGRESVVVYPPVRTSHYTIDPTIEREAWFLVVSALEPYKRTDLAIAAANRAQLPLKVVGSGSQLQALRAMAGPTVQVLGRVSDAKLRDLYRRARALLHPQMEDFGIIAVEAQACGCPVVAYAAGGALETVTARTGVFFPQQTEHSLLEAVERLHTTNLRPDDCRANALRFDDVEFDRGMTEQAAGLLASPGRR